MSTGRYDTTGNPEAQFESGSNNLVLRNKLSIQNSAEMDNVELDLLTQLYDVIPDRIEVDQPIYSSDIKEWHRRWLGNVYSWAGQYRSVNVSKGALRFAAATQINRLMENLDRYFLSRYTPCAGMNDDELIEAISIVHVELILIHPFREGNGRMSRLLANVMAMQASKPELDFSLWDAQKERYFAAIQAGLGDYKPMKEMVRQVLRSASGSEDE